MGDLNRLTQGFRLPRFRAGFKVSADVGMLIGSRNGCLWYQVGWGLIASLFMRIIGWTDWREKTEDSFQKFSKGFVFGEPGDLDNF